MSLAHSLHVDLDGAWPGDVPAGGDPLDCRTWGPRLRYCATSPEMEEFAEFIRPRQARFTLFGSGDFHHLSALWLRGVAEPFTLVSFDNHPDWDIRPPHWCCGTWVNRALALPNLQRVAIWGCGNFELNWPGYLWISRTALKAQRLAVWPWAERLKPSGRKRWGGIVRETWREDFSQFSRGLAGQAIYVTVDMDCLDERVAATNWEQGLFTAEDVAWALGEIRKHARIVGGDLCGAFSPQAYARPIQRFLATRDHPPLAERSPAETRERNAGVFADIWPVLTAG